MVIFKLGERLIFEPYMARAGLCAGLNGETIMINFESAIKNAHRAMKVAGKKVARGKWQGVDVSKRPEMTAHEVCHYTMRVPIATESLKQLQQEIRPNLPWADDHFEERVCGQPMNPGTEWANWPWGKSADKFRTEGQGLFDHNYLERYWPKVAGGTTQATYTPEEYEQVNDMVEPHRGIRYDYGDLNDVVEELYQDPTTRQAILPVFFPEDTGFRPGRRKPCSLHYHFMLNEGKLDIQYVLRSCDLIRHFRDDIYLTVRLLLWMLDRLRERPAYNNYSWRRTGAGLFVMHIANLHCFVNDVPKLEEELK